MRKKSSSTFSPRCRSIALGSAKAVDMRCREPVIELKKMSPEIRNIEGYRLGNSFNKTSSYNSRIEGCEISLLPIHVSGKSSSNCLRRFTRSR